MMLSVFVALFTVAASYKVEKTEAPNLLLDLYNSNVIERCDFQNLSSIAPIEVHPGTSESMLMFNLSLIKPMGLIHVVFDGKGPPNTLVKKTLEVVINGDKQKLSLESIRSAAIAAVPHTKLSGSTSLTVNMRELTALNFTIENIFLMTDIDESCEAWKEFRANKGPTKAGRNKSQKRLLKRSGVTAGCKRIPFEVDLRDIRRADDEKADEFIYTPQKYDIGTCGNRCVWSQLSPYALLRSNLREKIELNQAQGVYHQEVLKPACLPTSFGPLQIIFFSRVDNVMKLRLFKNVVVGECGCV